MNPNPLRRHYQDLFRRHADSPQAVQHADKESQNRRFAMLSQIIPSPDASILDVGCGLGHLEAYLRRRGHNGKYTGVDFVEEFIQNATKNLAKEPTKFLTLDIMDDPLPGKHDVAILSGVFNNKMENNWEFFQTVVRKMYEASTHGISFNALSTYVDYQDETLHYFDPLEVFDFCKKLDRRVDLLHSYILRPDAVPYEFTVFIHKTDFLPDVS